MSHSVILRNLGSIAAKSATGTACAVYWRWAAGLVAAMSWVAHAKVPNATTQLAGSVPRTTAPAATIYHLLGFSLRGTKHVDLNALVAALPQHAGDLIKLEDITADANRISGELKMQHVHGTLTTALLEREGKGHYVWVIWDIQKLDAMSHLPLRFSRHLGGQSFYGNIRLSSNQLDAATGLHPGDRMPDGSVSDARTGIEQAYDKVLPGKEVGVKGMVKLKKDDTVAIDWQITEPK